MALMSHSLKVVQDRGGLLCHDELRGDLAPQRA
jgi:hypothetical protein